jgi:glycosyltransferase involved in cell wall biosynthesis
MKSIVLHDYFESLEGGGRLSSILAQGLSADLGYGFCSKNHPFLTPFTFQQYNLKAYSGIPLWRQFKLAQAFFNAPSFLKNYDTVIYSGFYTPLAVRHHKHRRNILYCHTPPRFIYDQRDFYLKQLPFSLRPALKAFIKYLQPRYEDAIEQMDTLITNSENVHRRIQYYLNKEAIVIYPPCDTKHFIWQGQKPYYLSTGRLDRLKRIDLIIQAFLQMPDKYLIVTSGGQELKRLKKLAQNAPNIEFTGWIDDMQLASLVGHAIATLYLPKDEDFGISPLESMAAGKPVIGVAEGGLLESVISEKTGILLDSSLKIKAICEAVKRMTPQTALLMRPACEKQAQRFQTKVFLEKMQKIIYD